MGLSACTGGDRGTDYSNLSQNLQSQGLLRTETEPLDAPFSLADLARNFHDVVFHYEFHFKDGRLINQRIEKPLKRWSGHVRYTFRGDAVTPGDRADTRALMGRISGLTGLTFEEVEGDHDLMISIASRKGRKAISRHLADADMPTYKRRYDIWRQTPGWVCGATLSASWENEAELIYAHVFIGDEVSGVLRKACLHEEIVQALGLTNDSDRARPSIFNDDQEFAFLTEHDAILLRTLYHPLLAPGMRAAEAMPIARGLLSATLAARQAGNVRLTAGNLAQTPG